MADGGSGGRTVWRTAQRRPNPVFSEAYRSIVELLVRERHRAGLTQLALAQALGRSQSHVWKIERGERRLDTLELYFIAKAIGVDPGELFGRIAARLDLMGSGSLRIGSARHGPAPPSAPIREGEVVVKSWDAVTEAHGWPMRRAVMVSWARPISCPPCVQ